MAHGLGDKRRDCETVTYLGYPIVVHEHHLTIHRPDGRPIIGGRFGFPTARAIIRGYRYEKEPDA